MHCCREDVLSMAVLNSSTIVTGDYEGRINFWNVHSGERRMTLFHTANRFETAVEQLLFLQPLQTSGWPCLLSCGGAQGLVSWKNGCCFLSAAVSSTTHYPTETRWECGGKGSSCCTCKPVSGPACYAME